MSLPSVAPTQSHARETIISPKTSLGNDRSLSEQGRHVTLSRRERVPEGRVRSRGSDNETASRPPANSCLFPPREGTMKGESPGPVEAIDVTLPDSNRNAEGRRAYPLAGPHPG